MKVGEHRASPWPPARWPPRATPNGAELEREALRPWSSPRPWRPRSTARPAAGGRPRSSPVMRKHAALLLLHHRQPRYLAPRNTPLTFTAMIRSKTASSTSSTAVGPLGHARVGVEDVEPAPARHRLLRRRPGCPPTSADVGAGSASAWPPALLDLLRGRLRPRPLEVHDRHPRALAREEQRGRLPDARARARDQGHPVLELHGRRSFRMAPGFLDVHDRARPSPAPARRASSGNTHSGTPAAA